MTSSSGAPGRVEGSLSADEVGLPKRELWDQAAHFVEAASLNLQPYSYYSRYTMLNGQTACNISQMSRKGLIQPFLQQSSSCPLFIRMF